jgi:hypothetical protein
MLSFYILMLIANVQSITLTFMQSTVMLIVIVLSFTALLASST